MAGTPVAKKSESTFATTQRVLGALVGGFSVFALVAKTWIGGIAAPLELIVDTYNALLNVALGWAQPYVHALAETLTRWTGFDLHLYPHWKESLVAYGILVGAGVSALIEAKLPAVPRPLATALGAAAGVVVGLIDAMLQRDLQPDDEFYALWQMLGQSYLLVLVFASGALFAFAGYLYRRLEPTMMSAADVDLSWTVGERTLGIFAGAAAFAILGAGGKALGL